MKHENESRDKLGRFSQSLQTDPPYLGVIQEFPKEYSGVTSIAAEQDSSL